MLCPKCHFEQPDGAAECARCGVIFAKLRAAEPTGGPAGDAPPPPTTTPEPAPPTAWTTLRDEWLLAVEPSVNPFYFAGRVLVYAGLTLWSWKFITTPLETNYVGESFLHNINLPFHEAGHLIFSPFGRFLNVLGGSLGQVLMPLICAAAFLIKNRDPFGTSVGLWWMAENFMDLAPYINDARALELPLLGGVTGQDVEDYHDWEYLLRTLDWLQHDHTLAHASYRFGTLVMIGTLLWGGYLLLRQYRNLDRS